MPLYVRTVLLTGPVDEVEAAVEGHKRHLTELREKGRLRAAGAFGRGDGFLEVFEAKDLLEAEAIARSSPIVAEGLGAWTIREWEDLERGQLPK